MGYGYDANGNHTSMSDGAGSQTYAYDELDRLTEVTRGADSFAYEYDPAGSLTRRTYPGGSITDYTHDDDGRLETVTRSGQPTRYSYDPAGNLTRTELPAANGYAETRAYDPAGWLTEVRNANAGATLSFSTYSYDNVGNPNTITTQDGTSTYTYDPLDRLTEACYQASCPGAADPYIRYGYDAVGNRTSETRPEGATTYSYDPSDRLTSKTGPGGTVSYDFDANGNQTRAGNRSFGYDLADRVTSTSEAGATTSYGYDGDGNRLAASTAGQTTNYLWDLNHQLPQLAIERDGAGSQLRAYVYGNDRISMETGGQAFYYHRDVLGSTTNLTSAGGATQWSHSYEPFGNQRSTVENDPAAPANPIRFAGEQLDDTGLYHLRARQYDPADGRFLTRDPLPPAATAPYPSTYIYANNRPTALIDPSGKGAVWPDGYPIAPCVRGPLGGQGSWPASYNCQPPSWLQDNNGGSSVEDLLGGAAELLDDTGDYLGDTFFGNPFAATSTGFSAIGLGCGAAAAVTGGAGWAVCAGLAGIAEAVYSIGDALYDYSGSDELDGW